MVRNNARKRDLEKAGTVVRRLSEIIAVSTGDLDNLLDELLKLGCEVFEADVGMVSKISGERYHVVAIRAPSQVELRSGNLINLADTYCERTLEADGVVGIESAEKEGLGDHTARTRYGFESYFGNVVRTNDKTFGTLSFSNLTPRKRGFGAVESDCLSLMSAWLGTELSRRHKEDLLGTTNRKLEETRQQMKRLATLDPLTGALNRRSALERLADERNRAAREGSALGIFVMDADRFRRVNDAIGYQGGDQILVEVISRVMGCLRTYDHLGRLGGKQFLAVLPGCSLAEAAEIAERARIALESRPIKHPDGEFDITASFGVTSADASDITEDELLSTADKALFLAKQHGKNSVRGASPRGQDSPTAVV